MPTDAPPADLLQLDCRTCGAELVFEPHLKTAECPYCASPNVVERPPSADRPPPAFAVGFQVDAERAAEIARRWLRSRGPFAHGGLKEAAVERTRGVYLPAYLYSASAHARWSADIGEDYVVVETYVTIDSKGRPVTRTRTRTETEWSYLSGEWATWVSDVLVSASRGLPNPELEAVEPFDLRAIRRYGPGIVAGWIAEEPSVDPETCRRTAHDETATRIDAAVRDFLPGDRQRSVEIDSSVGDESTALVLLPVWVYAVRYAEAKPPLRLVINGQTGAAAGKVPLSVPKVTVGILLLVALVVLVVALAGGFG